MLLCALKENLLAMKQSKYAKMLALMEKGTGEGLWTADELLHIGQACLNIPEYPHNPSAKIAFRTASQLMRSQKAPDMEQFAEVMPSSQSFISIH